MNINLTQTKNNVGNILMIARNSSDNVTNMHSILPAMDDKLDNMQNLLRISVREYQYFLDVAIAKELTLYSSRLISNMRPQVVQLPLSRRASIITLRLAGAQSVTSLDEKGFWR
jgi:hypothetical protein